METTILPRDVIGWIALGLGTLFLILSFWKNRRSDTIKNLQESNDTLRKLLDDLTKEQDQMRNKLELVVKKTELQAIEIKTLQQDRETFSGLIKAALVDYFKQNPIVADKTKVKIEGTMTTETKVV